MKLFKSNEIGNKNNMTLVLFISIQKMVQVSTVALNFFYREKELKRIVFRLLLLDFLQSHSTFFIIKYIKKIKNKPQKEKIEKN